MFIPVSPSNFLLTFALYLCYTVINKSDQGNYKSREIENVKSLLTLVVLYENFGMVEIIKKYTHWIVFKIH